MPHATALMVHATTDVKTVSMVTCVPWRVLLIVSRALGQRESVKTAKRDLRALIVKKVLDSQVT